MSPTPASNYRTFLVSPQPKLSCPQAATSQSLPSRGNQDPDFQHRRFTLPGFELYIRRSRCMHFCAWLLPLSVPSAGVIYVATVGSPSLLGSIPVYGCTTTSLSISQLVDIWVFSGFGPLCSTAGNVLVHILGGDMYAFLHIPRNGVAGPWGMCIVCFLLQF